MKGFNYAVERVYTPWPCLRVQSFSNFQNASEGVVDQTFRPNDEPVVHSPTLSNSNPL